MGPIAGMPSLLRTKAIASLCSDNTSKIDAMVCRNNLEEQEEEPQSSQIKEIRVQSRTVSRESVSNNTLPNSCEDKEREEESVFRLT